MKYRVEFTISDDAGHYRSDSYEFEPFPEYERDSWAIADELGSHVRSVADSLVWSWFA